LHPGGVQQVVEQAVQREHADFAGVDEVQRRFGTVRRDREDAQLAAQDQVAARHDLPLVENGRSHPRVADDQALPQQCACSRTELPEGFEPRQNIERTVVASDRRGQLQRHHVLHSPKQESGRRQHTPAAQRCGTGAVKVRDF
jgi:hypothetical protein